MKKIVYTTVIGVLLVKPSFLLAESVTAVDEIPVNLAEETATSQEQSVSSPESPASSQLSSSKEATSNPEEAPPKTTAHTKTSQDKKNTYWRQGWYAGLGIYDHAFDDIAVAGDPVTAGTGLALSFGYVKPWRAHTFIDVSVNYNFSDGDTIDTGTCGNGFGGTVSCDKQGVNSVFSIPATLNYRKDINSETALYIGAGAAFNYVTRGTELTADGFQSNGLDDVSSTSFGPYFQAGVLYKQFRFNTIMNLAVGDDEVGEGDVVGLIVEFSW